MNNHLQKLMCKSAAITALIIITTLPSCNKSDNNYFAVSPQLTALGVINTGSWYAFRDSLGTAVDTIKVASVTNTFNPIDGEAEGDLYQTITINFTHTLLNKQSKVVMVRTQEKSICNYTNTNGEITQILADPEEAGVTINRIDSLKSGKFWFTDVLVVSEASDPAKTLYIAKGKWLVKKIYSSNPAQNWTLDALVIK